MNDEVEGWLIVGAIVLVFIVLFAFAYDHQKTECLANGGRWISGMMGGNFSYFCIPK
jgi:uncharacterized membrane protein